MLWPSAGKGGQNVAVHAQTHNFFVSANGNGENFDRLGRPVGADASFNFTLPPRQQRHKKNPADVADGCFHGCCRRVLSPAVQAPEARAGAYHGDHARCGGFWLDYGPRPLRNPNPNPNPSATVSRCRPGWPSCW